MRTPTLRTVAILAALAVQASAQTGAIVTGEILDIDGDPVPCAAVILDSDEIAQRMRVADEEGVYRFIDLPAGDYTIEIFAPGVVAEDASKAAAVVDEFTISGEQADDETEITRDYLDLEFREEPLPGTVTGRLVEPADAKGPTAPGVRLVRVNARGEDCTVLDFTYTCTDGTFELNVPDNLVGARLEFAGGAILQTGIEFDLSNDDLTDLGDLAVTPTENFTPPAISFIVTDAEDGDPIPRARIIGRNSNQEFEVFTNCTGIVEIDGLQDGGYSLTISASGYEGRFRSVTADGTDILPFSITLQAIDPDNPPKGRCAQSMGTASSSASMIGNVTTLLGLSVVLIGVGGKRRNR